MKSISKMLTVIVLLLSVNSFAQAKNTKTVTSDQVSQLKQVFEGYLSIKDALVKTDAGTASEKAAELAASIKAVDMSKLSADEHTAWMHVLKNLSANAEAISKSKDIGKQREVFAALSTSMYELAKVSRHEAPVYYQHCPMYNNGKGANWLSRDNVVKNPYYGAAMISCGSTVETLK